MVMPDQESTTPDESTEVNEPPTLDSLSERIKSLQDENDKLGKDLSAAKGQIRSQGDRDREYLSRLDALGSSMVKAFRDNQDDPDQAIRNLEQQQYMNSVQAMFQTDATSMRDRLLAVQYDPDGNELFSIEDDDLADVRNEFASGFNAKDTSGAQLSESESRNRMQNALETARDIQNRKMWERLRDRTVDAQQAEERLGQAFSMDTDSGPDSGGASRLSDEANIANIANNPDATPEQLRRAQQYFENLKRGIN